MRTIRVWMLRVGCWLTRRRDEERLTLELEEHLSLQIAENLSAGMSEAEARRQAAVKVGNIASIRESYWDQKGWPFGESLLRDLRLAFRQIFSSPGFAVTSILILGLGIGSVTSIFTLAYAVLFRSLAVERPPAAVTQTHTARARKQRWFLTIYTDISRLARKGLRNWRHFRPAPISMA